MNYTGTHQVLFIEEADPHSFFEKEASISRMPDDEKKWPAHMLSEIHKALPFLSDYDVDLELTSMDAEAGTALGYAMVRNKSMQNSPVKDLGKASNRVRIPIIIQDRMLQPFHTFELGGGHYPLTADRVEAAMVNPAIFDSSVNKVPRSPSLVDQTSPPYQQRQGFGRTGGENTGAMAGGHGKSASAPSLLDVWGSLGRTHLSKLAAAEDAPNYRKAGDTACAGCKFFNPTDGGGQGQCSKYDFVALADHTCDSWASRDPAKEASHEKNAGMAKGASMLTKSRWKEYGEDWLKRYESTPFFKEALSIQEEDANIDLQKAESGATRALAHADDAAFRIKIAQMESGLARWKKEAHGIKVADTLDKLACCREENRSWSDEFMTTPMYKEALVLEAENSDREIGRLEMRRREELEWRLGDVLRVKVAQLDAKISRWKLAEFEGTKEASYGPALGGAVVGGLTGALTGRKFSQEETKTRNTGLATLVGTVAGSGIGHLAGKGVRSMRESGGVNRTMKLLTKRSSAPGIVAGAGLGYAAGSATAKATAKATAPTNRRAQAEAIARKLATVGVSLGAAAGAFVGTKHIAPKVKEALKHLSDDEIKFVAQLGAVMASSIAGAITAGAATGMATGGSMRLKQKMEEIRGRK